MGSQSRKHAVLLCMKTPWRLKRFFENNETLENLNCVVYEVVLSWSVTQAGFYQSGSNKFTKTSQVSAGTVPLPKRCLDRL